MLQESRYTMSEFQNHESIRTMQVAVEKAADIVGGPGSNPLEVFPDPTEKERRADIVWGDNFTENEQAAFRAVVAELGPGREDNVGPAEIGIETSNYVALFEGGQAHKMVAQLNLVDNPNTVKPAAFILSGSTGRSISDAEIQSAAKTLGIEVSDVATNEAQLALQAVQLREGFIPKSSPEMIEETEAYSIHTVGTLHSVPVNIMGIHRLPREDGGYIQISNQEKIEVVGGMLGSEGLDTPVVFATSATYQPSNAIAAARAEAASGIEVHVITYGTHELARVKGTEPAKPSIAQLGAEAYKTAKLLEEEV